ncbi:MAG: ATP-binding protein [Pyrobaculum sp.]
MERIRLELAPGVETEFVDRDRALAQVVEWAERGTWPPFVVFGPEGCGKTAFLRQAAEALRELGYDVFYLHPLDRVFLAEVDDPRRQDTLPRPCAEDAGGREVRASRHGSLRLGERDP